MTKKTEAQNWRKFLGITEPKTGKASARAGGLIGKTAGNASGSGITDRDGNPEGSERETAENGDGSLNGGKALQVGDKGDRLTDLYDCETGEEVTIDGLGGKGTEAYPSGFHDCQASDVEDGYNPAYFWYQKSERSIAGSGTSEVVSESYHQTKKQALAATWQNDELQSKFDGDLIGSAAASEIPNCHYLGCVILGATITRGSCAGATNPQAIATCNMPPPKPKWPAVDRNHLTWNKEKNCFEPLCPELNTQVLNKYKSCEDERILCDKDGNKVKVKVDGGVVKVTQEKYGQTAEIKNGKVTAVKKLTESQLEAEFK